MNASAKACVHVRLPHFVAVLLLLAPVLLSSGCKPSSVDLGKDVVATVGGIPVTVEELMAACDGEIPEKPGEKNAVLDRLINNRLASRAAVREGFMATPAMVEGFYNDRLPDLLLKKIQDDTVVTEEELQAAKGKAGLKPVVGVSELVAPTMKDAEAALAELGKGADFKLAAGKYSVMKAETDKEVGLDNAEGIYPSGVMAVLNRLKPGEMSPIIKLDIGYAVIRLNYRKGPDDLWKAKEKDLRAQIKQLKAQAELDRLMDKLRSSGDVKLVTRKMPGGEVQYTGAVANGVEISMDPRFFNPSGDPHFAHSGMNPKTLRDALNKRINEVLLSQEARRRGLDQDPEFQREVVLKKEELLADAILERVRGTYQPTQQDLKEYYDKNKDKYTGKAQVRISRVLLDTVGDAQAALNELKAGKDFASIARARSMDSATSDKGGDVGYVVPEIMKEPLKSAILKMKPGDISGILKTDYGYELLKATDRKEGVATPMANLSGTLKKRVALIKQSERVESFFKGLKDKADIKVNEKLLESLK